MTKITLLKRLKNIWQLSNFEITRFDNQLVITKKEEKLVVNSADEHHLPIIIKRTTPTQDFLKQK